MPMQYISLALWPWPFPELCVCVCWGWGVKAVWVEGLLLPTVAEVRWWWLCCDIQPACVL